MPEINNSDTIRSQYLNSDRGVNLDRLVREREQVEQGKLDGVEFRDRPKSMDRDDFLKLLVKQLTTQDPTAPVQDQQFIAQMAQFSSLEQMKNMADGFQSMSNRQAIGLVGKFVIGKDYTTGESANGVVQALVFDSAGQAFLKVGSKAILVKDVEMVADPSSIRQEFGGQAPVSQPGQPAAAPSAQPPASAQPAQNGSDVPATPQASRENPSDAPGTTSSSSDRQGSPAPREGAPAPAVPAAQGPQSIFYYGDVIERGEDPRAKTEFAA